MSFTKVELLLNRNLFNEADCRILFLGTPRPTNFSVKTIPSIALHLLQSIAQIQDEAEFHLLQSLFSIALAAAITATSIASLLAIVFLTIALIG